ncbi:hypothetical protein ACFXAZ_26745 [Streptomyces sp. NPDC059477]|uniref:hypothetical protein n=1 Tax=Streptomyces sp. NPDC059477 TaxID=3346847 RepID=UPI0036AD9DA4
MSDPAVDAYVRGAARLQRNATDTADVEDGAPRTARERERERDRALDRLVDFSRFPALDRALAASAVPYAQGRFAFGSRRLLDGIEGAVGEPQAPGCR